MITCWIYIQPDAEQPTDDSNFIKYFVKSASNLFINDLNPSHELCDIIELVYQDILSCTI